MSNQLLILGSGFGLYGYLPAALSTDWEVTTLSRYRDFLNNRDILGDLTSQVNFVDEKQINLKRYSGVVIARTPDTQSQLVYKNPEFQGHFFLEKPLGLNSKSHLSLVNFLREKHLNFSVGYLFRFLDWFKSICSCMKSDCKVSIEWSIPRNSINSWKVNPGLGGGLLSYYGVHFLSLLVDLGLDEGNLTVNAQPDTLEVLASDTVREIRIFMAFADQPEFRVSISSLNGMEIFNLASPFGSVPDSNSPDPRIPYLSKYLAGWGKILEHENLIMHELRVVKLRMNIETLLYG